MEEALALTATSPGSEDDRERLGAFFDVHHQRLFRFALRIGRDREESLDLIQEAFLRAARRLRTFPLGDDDAMSWMVRVIVNLAHDRYRRQRLRDLFTTLFRTSDSPNDPRNSLVSAVTIHSALASLPPRQRAVIALCELEGTTVADAAVAPGIAQATVRWHLAEARKRLASILGVHP